MRKTLILTSSLLLLIHLIFVFLINSNSKLLLNLSAEFIEYKVTTEFDSKIKKVKTNKYYKLSNSILSNVVEKSDDKILSTEETIKEEIHNVANHIASMSFVDQGKTFDSFNLLRALEDKEYLKECVKFQYFKTLNNLLKDVNILLLTNSLSLLLGLLASYFKGNIPIVMKLSWILISTVIISSLFYVFSQNWFYSIIMNKYYSFLYSAIQLIVGLFLLNIILNKSRVS